MNKALVATLLLSIVIVFSSGCASVRTLDAAQAGAPVIYSGTRLDWYSLQGGCYPVERFGAQAPKYAALDLPLSLLLDTVLLPWALAVELGIGLTVQGGH